MSDQRPDAPADPAQLLLRVAQHDREAFAALFLLIAPKVKGYLLRQGASPAAAEELAQEAMLSIWRKAGLFNPAKAGATTWIFVIARNLRIDSLRRERATVTYGAHPPERPDDAAPLALGEGPERENRVRRAMDDLPDEQREVVRRAYFDDEPHARIAEALGLPLGTVKSRLRLAMGKLRARLEDLR